jgi:hypothetical protein
LFAQHLGEIGQHNPFRGNFGQPRYYLNAIENFVQEKVAYKVEVRDEDLPHLAYCLLANYPLSIPVLKNIQRIIQHERDKKKR